MKIDFYDVHMCWEDLYIHIFFDYTRGKKTKILFLFSYSSSHFPSNTPTSTDIVCQRINK